MQISTYLKKYLVARFIVILGILQITRFIFYLVNRDMFLGETEKILLTFGKSVLFDLLCTFLYFTPYVLLLFLPLFFKEIRKWQLILLNLYFYGLFWFVGLLSVADIFYYRFNLRRINLEALKLLQDSHLSILNFVKHKPASLLILLLLGLIFYLFSASAQKHQRMIVHAVPGKTLSGILIAYCILAIMIIFNLAKYFSPLSSSLMVPPGYTGLYTNSPQAFIYSFRSGWTFVRPLHHFSDEEADRMVPVFYSNANSRVPNKRNIILFILESFSYSYLDPSNTEKPSTPFFDSLIAHSTFFTNAYANNTTSANGLCSILSGIPSLTNQAFFSSAYADNPVKAIGIALNRNGYTTGFFLGANDDHFGFKKGTRLLGINHYYNGETFPASQHDGTWGIYDAPFLQYFAERTDGIQQPFFSVFFTISSHYPFRIPDSLKNRFSSKHNHPNEIAVSYVDYSFRLFFERVRKSDWFQNTIFIFTGDHVSKENKRERQNFNFNSYYHIPIFVFDPQNPEPNVIENLVQHTDIPATIAQLTGIGDTVLSFGQPFYDSTHYHYSVNRYSENIVQLIDTSTLLQYDILNDKLLDIYRIQKNDGLLRISDKETIREISELKVPVLKAYMQQYFNRLYYNRLYRK